MRKTSKYLALFRMSAFRTLTNYKTLCGLSVFLITSLIIFSQLWKTIASKVEMVNFDPTQLFWYIALNEWVLVSIPSIQDEMEQDLRSGRLAYLLPRPVSYLGSVFAEAAGTLVVNFVVLGTVTCLFAGWQAGFLSISFKCGSLIILLGLMGGFLAILFQMLIGLSAFWLSEVTPFYWIWEKLLFMFGGLMLPLAVYPQWMQSIAHCTPFPAILGDRSFLIADCSDSHIFFLLASVLCWGFLSLVLLNFFYRKGLNILNIEGC